MFKQHLNESGKTYTKHFVFAFVAGWLLIYAGITSIIHSIVPSLFPFTSQKIVQKLLSNVKER